MGRMSIGVGVRTERVRSGSAEESMAVEGVAGGKDAAVVSVALDAC